MGGGAGLMIKDGLMAIAASTVTGPRLQDMGSVCVVSVLKWLFRRHEVSRFGR